MQGIDIVMSTSIEQCNRVTALGERRSTGRGGLVSGGRGLLFFRKTAPGNLCGFDFLSVDTCLGRPM